MRLLTEYLSTKIKAKLSKTIKKIKLDCTYQEAYDLFDNSNFKMTEMPDRIIKNETEFNKFIKNILDTETGNICLYSENLFQEKVKSEIILIKTEFKITTLYKMMFTYPDDKLYWVDLDTNSWNYFRTVGQYYRDSLYKAVDIINNAFDFE